MILIKKYICFAFALLVPLFALGNDYYVQKVTVFPYSDLGGMVFRVHKSGMHAYLEVFAPNEASRSRLVQSLVKTVVNKDFLLYGVLAHTALVFSELHGRSKCQRSHDERRYIKRAVALGLMGQEILSVSVAEIERRLASLSLSLESRKSSVDSQLDHMLYMSIETKEQNDSGIYVGRPSAMFEYYFFWRVIYQNWDIAWLGVGNYSLKDMKIRLLYRFEKDHDDLKRSWRHLDCLMKDLRYKVPPRMTDKIDAMKASISAWLKSE